MFDISKTLKDFNLSEEQYEEFLKDCSNKTYKINDMDWSEICEKYNIDWSGDTLRKSCQPPLSGSSFVKQYYEEKISKGSSTNEEEYLKKLDEKKREIERLKIQYRDERNAWSKQNYSAARLDTTLTLLGEKLKKIGMVEFTPCPTPIISNECEMIVCLSDLHIGQTFESFVGEYNSHIAKERLNKYLNKVIEVGTRHEISKVHVVGLGDLISGSIHRTIAVTNRENVIEQVKVATEYIASFCYELTKKFSTVQFSNVVGNHSRLEKKEDALHDERLDDIIGWAVNLTLSHIENFHYMNHRMLDNGIADLSVCGKTYIAVHGDYDAQSNQGISNLVMALGFRPLAIIKGHMHHSAYTEFNGVKMIQSGTLAGSGDSYTIEKRLTGKPSQTILVCNAKGIDCIYNVELD